MLLLLLEVVTFDLYQLSIAGYTTASKIKIPGSRGYTRQLS